MFLIWVGIKTFKYNQNQEDYLAGRTLSPWVAFSERASGESAWLLLALPGLIAVGFKNFGQL